MTHFEPLATLITSLSPLGRVNALALRRGERQKSDAEDGLIPSRRSGEWQCPAPCKRIHLTSVTPACRYCGRALAEGLD